MQQQESIEDVNTARLSSVAMVLDSLLDALECKNVSRVLDVYDSEPVMFTLAPPLQNTSDNSKGADGVRQWLDSFAEGPRFETRDRHIFVDNQMAIAYCLTHLSGRKVDGEMVDLWYRETNCLRHVGDEWKIFHQHESVPFYMDKDRKAALDLKPELQQRH